jgi:hypothetical protein
MSTSKSATESTAETEPAASAAPPTEPAASEPTASEPTAVEAPAGRVTDITAGQGGVMTDEVGVVTGELTLRTELSGDRVTVHVQYKDADEWYAVTGAQATLENPADLEAVHTVAVGILHRPQG